MHGLLTGGFDKLKNAGCIQCENDSLRPMFSGLMQLTGGDVCEECPITKGDCRAHQQYHTDALRASSDRLRHILNATTPAGGETTKQVAARLGISKNEVRRRRTAGTLQN